MRKNMRRFCIGIGVTIIVGVFLLPAGALAAKGVPKIISHQGRLMDSSSSLLGGSSGTNFCFRFSIYDASSGGTKLWPSGTPSTMTVDVTDGVYNVGVGDTAASGDTLDFNFEDNDTVYLNIEVENSVSGSCGGVSSFETLTPRHRITASGYAINSNAVRGVEITSSTIPLLGANPQINATSTNTLTLQGGSGTGDIQFFSSSNKITSTGALTLAGAITFSNLTDCDTIDTNGSGVLTCGTDAGSSATTLQGAFDNDANGSNTIIALTANDDSLVFRNPASGGTDSAFLLQLDQLATSTLQIGLDINQDSYVSGAAGLRIDVASTSPSAVPHILFGQSGTFDTNLYRNSVNVLKTDDDFIIGGTATISGLTNGSILFATSSGVISQDNDNFFWDDVANTLILDSDGKALSIRTNLGVEKIFTNINGGNAEMSFDDSSGNKDILLSTITDSFFINGLNIGGTTNALASISLDADGSATFNEQGNNQDFRIEGDTAIQLFVANAGTDTIEIGTLTDGAIAKFAPTEITFNEFGSATIDLRVEGDTEQNLLFVDASTNRVGIGMNNPATTLDITGTFNVTGDLTANGAVTLGDGGDEISINSSDWDISNIGALTGINTIAFDSSTSTIAAFTYGGNVDASSNLLLNIGNAGTDFTSGGGLAIAGTLEVATTTSQATFTFEGTTGVASGVAAMYESITFNPSGGGTQFGNRIRIYNKPTSSANTAIGTFIRVDDNTSLANTVRGLEIQAAAGSNTTGVNTGLRAFGKTFGIQGITDALAGGTLIPAGIFAETEGTTFGNALRAYSSSITSSDLVQFFQETTAFSGDGLLMNFGEGSGSFTGNFLNLKVNDVTQFSVSSAGNVMATGTLAVAATTTLAETAGRVGIGTTSPVSLLNIIGGGVVVGTPTGGDKGAGTINASAVYDDNVLLTGADYVFDKYFDGVVEPIDEELHGAFEMLTISEMNQFISDYRHLPTITGRDEWLEVGGLSLGALSMELWETAETSVIYITQLDERLKDLEAVDFDEMLAQAKAEFENSGSSSTSRSGVIELLYDTIKSALASLGLFVSDGVVEVEELRAQTVTLNKLQLYDQATGGIYCTWIERGEWRKEPGVCDDQVPLAPQFESEPEEIESEEPAGTEENAVEEEIVENSVDEDNENDEKTGEEEVVEEGEGIAESEPEKAESEELTETGENVIKEEDSSDLLQSDNEEASFNSFEQSEEVAEEADEPEPDPESEPESLDSNNEEEMVEPVSSEF